MEPRVRNLLLNDSFASRRRELRNSSISATLAIPLVDPQLDNSTALSTQLKNQSKQKQDSTHVRAENTNGKRTNKTSAPLADVLNKNTPKLRSIPLDQEQDDSRPRKSRRLESESTRRLPKPPARAGNKTTLPPMLAPLHNPPVDAQIIPSISSDRFRPIRNDPPSSPPTEELSQILPWEDSIIEQSSEAFRPGKKGKRSKWTTEETNFLIQGVAKFGIGNWKKILKHNEYEFSPGRNSMDLKDRFRTCFPDEYRRSGAQLGRLESVIDDSGKRRGRGGRTIVELARMGLDTDMQFPKLERRQRKTFTEEEDDSLLSGFHKHHSQWKKIQSDPELNLSHRTRTDLRDRFRNRYPQLFKDAGYKHKAKQGTSDEATSSTTASTNRKVVISNQATSNISMPNMSEELELATLLLRHNNTTGSNTHVESMNYPPLPSMLSSGIIDPYDSGHLQDAANVQLNRDIFEWSHKHENGPNASHLPLSRILNADNHDEVV